MTTAVCTCVPATDPVRTRPPNLHQEHCPVFRRWQQHAKDLNKAKSKQPYPGDLNPIETAVWAAEYVRYLAARSDSTKRWPPDQDDVDDAIDNANETVLELRRARDRCR